ncbi:hypothetical protein RRG08_031599 [Elysia crispata]|uniref:Uncharacterized protein n=1 Tax=Elysia crispata TaxID=231223 RepID=A0AAE1B2Y1_9GAST|nr:hypothetical protein RRG08_031599 [Elysia crispata]
MATWSRKSSSPGTEWTPSHSLMAHASPCSDDLQSRPTGRGTVELRSLGTTWNSRPSRGADSTRRQLRAAITRVPNMVAGKSYVNPGEEEQMLRGLARKERRYSSIRVAARKLCGLFKLNHEEMADETGGRQRSHVIVPGIGRGNVTFSPSMAPAASGLVDPPLSPPVLGRPLLMMLEKAGSLLFGVEGTLMMVKLLGRAY